MGSFDAGAGSLWHKIAGTVRDLWRGEPAFTVGTDVAGVAQLRSGALTLVTDPHMSVLDGQAGAQERLLGRISSLLIGRAPTLLRSHWSRAS